MCGGVSSAEEGFANGLWVAEVMGDVFVKPGEGSASDELRVGERMGGVSASSEGGLRLVVRVGEVMMESEMTRPLEVGGLEGETVGPSAAVLEIWEGGLAEV